MVEVWNDTPEDLETIPASLNPKPIPFYMTKRFMKRCIGPKQFSIYIYIYICNVVYNVHMSCTSCEQLSSKTTTFPSSPEQHK